jgi:hypothetical protein
MRAASDLGADAPHPGSQERGEEMTRRRWLVRVFPRSWTSRFGEQLTGLLDDIEKETGRIPVADRLDVARAGLGERMASVGRVSGHRRALVSCGVVLSIVAAGALIALEGDAGRPARQVVSPQTTTQVHRAYLLPVLRGPKPRVVQETAAYTARDKTAAAAAAAQAAAAARAAAQSAAAKAAAIRRDEQVAAINQARARAAAQAASLKAAEAAAAQAKGRAETPRLTQH